MTGRIWALLQLLRELPFIEGRTRTRARVREIDPLQLLRELPFIEGHAVGGQLCDRAALQLLRELPFIEGQVIRKMTPTEARKLQLLRELPFIEGIRRCTCSPLSSMVAAPPGAALH